MTGGGGRKSWAERTGGEGGQDAHLSAQTF
jgi:hypothetical protein